MGAVSSEVSGSVVVYAHPLPFAAVGHVHSDGSESADIANSMSVVRRGFSPKADLVILTEVILGAMYREARGCD